MNGLFRSIFFSRHNEIRSGWRMVMFIGILIPGLGVMTLVSPYLPLASDLKGPLLGILVVLGATFVVTRWVNKKPLGAVGLFLTPPAMRNLGIGVLAGVCMIAAIAAVQGAAGTLTLSVVVQDPVSLVRTVVVAGLSFILAGFLEELLFRGYLFQTLMQAVTFLPAALVFSALFAVAHTANPNTTPIGLVNVGLAGLWLSFAYLKTRSLWLPTGLHIGWNFAQTTLFGYPTSGIGFEGYRVVTQMQEGPAWLTGGAFGAEGSLLATLAIVGSTWFVIKSRTLSAPEGIVTLDSLEDLIGPGNGDQPA